MGQKHWSEGLSTRAYNALRMNDCDSRKDVIAAIKSGTIRGFATLGKVSLDEICSWAGVSPPEEITPGIAAAIKKLEDAGYTVTKSSNAQVTGAAPADD